jgi:hypothetical protein
MDDGDDGDDRDGGYGGTYDADFDDGNTEIGNVCVSVRVRPLTDDERAFGAGGNICVELTPEDPKRITVVSGRRADNSSFSFDYVFGPDAPQEQVRRCCFAPFPRALVWRALPSQRPCRCAPPHAFVINVREGRRCTMLSAGRCWTRRLEGTTPPSSRTAKQVWLSRRRGHDAASAHAIS